MLRREIIKSFHKLSPTIFLIHIVLYIGSIVFLVPFLFMVIGSFKEEAEIFTLNPTLLPEQGFRLKYYFGIFDWIKFWRVLFNTVFVSTVAALIGIYLCSLGGYGFAKFRFAGRNALFIVLLSTMMIPYQIRVVPQFIIIKWIGWLNTYYALIVPGVVNAFGIFLMRQYIQAIPDELIDSARIDGCSALQIYHAIILPLIKPGLIVLGFIYFTATWNDFLWPLVVLNEEEMFTLPVALASLLGGDSARFGLIPTAIYLAGCVMGTIPVLIVFLVLQRWIIRGILTGALKG